MAKKPNIFSSVIEDITRARTDGTNPAASPTASKPAYRGPVEALGQDLRDSITNMVRDLDTAVIDESEFSDRFPLEEADVQDLVESIGKNGLRVPILVRPNPNKSGRFIIVYGRRRLAALRKLGLQARALIKNMDIDESIIIQGQENNARVNPSFIELAVFAHSLKAAGYTSALILESLSTSKPYLSHMNKVTAAVPTAELVKIGPAHNIGWRRWTEVAELITQYDLSPEIPADLFEGLQEDGDRFEAWVTHLRSEANAAYQRSLEPKAPPLIVPKSHDQSVSKVDDKAPVATEIEQSTVVGAVQSPVRAAPAVALPKPRDPSAGKMKTAKVIYDKDSGQKVCELKQDVSGIRISVSGTHQEFSDWLTMRSAALLDQLYLEWSAKHDQSQ